jgi:tellurite resistance-related uncharacterized protein
MVISQLIGGLGNQMFQYAAGRALAVKNLSTLALDVSAFSTYDLHQGFELQRIFSCPAKIATVSDIKQVLGLQAMPLFRRVMSRPYFRRLADDNLVLEPHFHFWPQISAVSGECYLQGYWQSEKYFKDIEHLLRADFTFQTAMTGQNRQVSEQIPTVNAISLHIRRGDYVNNPSTLATHGVCSPEYYRDAIQYIASRVAQPYFFIFSDDMAWVKAQFKLDFPCQYVEHNTGSESYNDMRLMSLCQHHIIANSSFSWWGAWLNASADKIVIAPKKWFQIDKMTQDIYPDGWVRL